MSSDKCLITKMLNELRTTRSSIKSQTAAIADVLDKSNNILLQIEASRSPKPTLNDNSTPYTYKKEMENALTRIVGKFMSLLGGSDTANENPNFEEYLDAAGQKADYLACNIRKLLAIWDTIQEMRLVLERQEHTEFNSEDESDTEECFEDNI